MLTRRTNWLCFGLLGLVVGVARGDYRHDCSCIVRVAGELQQDARDLGVEFRAMYRSTPQYSTLQSDIREIVSHAGHLQVLARAGVDVDEMKCDLDRISRSYRHLTQTVRAAEASCSPGPAWRYVNVPMRNGQVRRLLECIDKSLGQIKEEVAKLYVPRHRHDHDRRAPGNHGPSGFGPSGFTLNNPGNHGQTGLSIANGRLTFQFGR